MTSVGRIPDQVIESWALISGQNPLILLFIHCQWRIPDEEVTRLFRADSPETQKRILNNFARNLPVTNR